MKKIIVSAAVLTVLIACGGSKSGKDIAQEVCDCSKKANAMAATDPARAKAQQDCMTKQTEAWNSVKDDSKKSAEFNKTLSDCASQMIKESFK